ncbi:MAG: glycerol-3-phosphate 1-O-acyltransferase PlsY [Chloroflexia bacterium]|nr:glycerol-3-phosphate 1-O-acyltransferase PlsY [Chloroflexia bacterium]
MPGPLAGIAVTVSAFLIGAIPWGYVVARSTTGVDLREVGSGGTGATNVLRTLGFRASAIVFVLDVVKGVASVLLARALGLGTLWEAAAGVAVVAGHCWSPFIGFKGGKGVATGAGAATVLFPFVVAVLPLMAMIVWSTRYVSLGSLVSAAVATIAAVAFARVDALDWTSAVAIAVIFAIIVVRHESNIRRLMNGTERRLGDSH